MSTPLDNKPDGARQPHGRRQSGRRVRGPQLTERDTEIIRWMTRHGLVTAELVGRRFFWRPAINDYGKWAAYRRLRALRELGLVLSNKPYADQPAVLRVTREGAEIADVGLRPAPLVLSELRHSIAVVWLTEYLLAENAGIAMSLGDGQDADDLRQVQRELRELIFRYSPHDLHKPGRLRQEITDKQLAALRERGVDVEVAIPETVPLDRSGLELVHRVCGEALENVLRHAHASRVSVALVVEGAELVLTIDDDGRGFSAEDVERQRAAGHFGTRFLAEKAELAHGVFAVQSEPGNGAHVQLNLPVAVATTPGP